MAPSGIAPALKAALYESQIAHAYIEVAAINASHWEGVLAQRFSSLWAMAAGTKSRILGRAFYPALLTPKLAKAVAATGLATAIHYDATKAYFGLLNRMRRVPTGPDVNTPYDVAKVVGIDGAWAENNFGARTRVAVIDSGAWAHGGNLPRTTRHESIGVTGLTAGTDINGHGSSLAFEIGGARVDTDRGAVQGLTRAPLIVIKALETPLGLSVRDSGLLKALEIAVNRGAKVINMSLGGTAQIPQAEDPLCQTINGLAEKGILVVVAAGNSGDRGPASINTPGIAEKAITVGSVSMTDEGQRSHFSSMGPTIDGLVRPDVVMPGGGRAIADTEPGEYILGPVMRGAYLDYGAGAPDGWALLEGTSQAAPVMSAMLALWNDWTLSNLGRALTYDDIQTILTSNATGKKSNTLGYGMPKYGWVKEAPLNAR